MPSPLLERVNAHGKEVRRLSCVRDVDPAVLRQYALTGLSVMRYSRGVEAKEEGGE